MENVNLCLKPYHLAPLIEAVHARAVVIFNDTTSTPAERAVIADLEKRIELLFDAITAENTAKAAREAYNRHVQRRRYVNHHNDKAIVEAVTEPVESEQEPRSTATIAKRLT